MVLYNYQDREITGKIVYYGPSGVGKSTSLKHIYERVDEEARGKLMQVNSDEGRTLSFDFLPVNVGEITGMKIRFQLVTAPGAATADSSWTRMLQGADAIVFVADSDPKGLSANRESYEFLMEQLEGSGVDSDRIPLVFQLNKRDLASAASVEQINLELNLRRVPWFASSANAGEGVLETFQTIGRMLLVDIGRRYKEELLRKKREHQQRPQVPVPPQAEAAEPEEETRTIKVGGSSRVGQAGSETDDIPTRIVEPGELSEELAPTGAENPGGQEEPGAAASVRPAAAALSPSSDEVREARPEDASGNGRGQAQPDEAQRNEDDEPTAADLRVERLGRGAKEASSALQVEALRTQLAEVADQSLRLLETQSKLLRRIEELRQRIDRLGT